MLLGDVSWNDFVMMDEAIHTTAVHDDDWETALIAKARGENVVKDVDDSDEEGEELAEIPSARVALDRAKDIVNFALDVSDATMLDAATSLQDLLEIHCIRQAATARQTTMKDFFKAL